MRPLTEAEIRTSFVNTTKGERQRLTLPRALSTTPWDDLEFLGWRDPAAPQKAYLVLPGPATCVGIALRLASPSAARPRRSLCSLCLTTHAGDGVALMTARKAGRDGQRGDSVGTYVCSDLACSLYVRGLRHAGPGARMSESLTVEEQTDRLRGKAAEFVGAVTT